MYLKSNTMTRKHIVEQPRQSDQINQVKIDSLHYQFGHQIADGSGIMLYGTTDEYRRVFGAKAYAPLASGPSYNACQREAGSSRHFADWEVVELVAAFEQVGICHLVLDRFGHSYRHLKNRPASANWLGPEFAASVAGNHDAGDGCGTALESGYQCRTAGCLI
jgi:hypothetical protein